MSNVWEMPLAQPTARTKKHYGCQERSEKSDMQTWKSQCCGMNSKYLSCRELKRADNHIDACYCRWKENVFAIFAHKDYLSVWNVNHNNEQDDDDTDVDNTVASNPSNVNKSNLYGNSYVEASCISEYLPIDIENVQITALHSFER